MCLSFTSKASKDKDKESFYNKIRTEVINSFKAMHQNQPPSTRECDSKLS